MHRRLFQCALLAISCLAGVPAGAAAAVQDVIVSMNNYAITVSPATMRSGQVRFHVRNDSPDRTHELLVVKTELRPDQLPVKSTGHVDENDASLEKVASSEDIAPGGSKTLLVMLTPGHYVYFCNINGHHMLGMRGEFTVQAADL